MLEQIKDFEEQEFAGAKRDSDSKSMPASKLLPVNEGGSSALLNMEIQRLNEENEKLKERLSKIEHQALNTSRDKSALQANLDRANSELGAARSHKVSHTSCAFYCMMYTVLCHYALFIINIHIYSLVEILMQMLMNCDTR